MTRSQEFPAKPFRRRACQVSGPLSAGEQARGAAEARKALYIVADYGGTYPGWTRNQTMGAYVTIDAGNFVYGINFYVRFGVLTRYGFQQFKGRTKIMNIISHFHLHQILLFYYGAGISVEYSAG
jgi:hypothetical protein